jgi:hypothetical protein
VPSTAIIVTHNVVWTAIPASQERARRSARIFRGFDFRRLHQRREVSSRLRREYFAAVASLAA